MKFKISLIITFLFYINNSLFSKNCNPELFIGKWVDLDIKRKERATEIVSQKNYKLDNDDYYIRIAKVNNKFLYEVRYGPERFIFNKTVNVYCPNTTNLILSENESGTRINIKRIENNILKIIFFKAIKLGDGSLKNTIDFAKDKYLVKSIHNFHDLQNINTACRIFCGKYYNEKMEPKLKITENLNDYLINFINIQNKDKYSFLYVFNELSEKFAFIDYNGLYITLKRKNKKIILNVIKNSRKINIFSENSQTFYKLEDISLGYSRVIVKKANVRSSPKLKSEILYQLKQDEVVNVIDVDPKIEQLYNRIAPWVKIRDAKGREGYIWGGLLKPVEKK